MEVTRIGWATVKGSRHVEHDSVELTTAGAVGDRAFCLVDPATDRCLRTVENPALLQGIARCDGTTLEVELPSGTVSGTVTTTTSRVVDYWGRRLTVEVVDGPWAESWSEHLGREVVLARARPGDVVYAGPVTLVSTAALDRLSDRLGSPVDPARFRATLVVDGDDPRPGQRLAIGSTRLSVLGPVPRCAVVDLDPLTGTRDLAVLRALSRDGGPVFGVDADVTVPGRIDRSA